MNQFNNKHRQLFLGIGIFSILVGVVVTILSLTGVFRLNLLTGFAPIVAGAGCLLLASQIDSRTS